MKPGAEGPLGQAWSFLRLWPDFAHPGEIDALPEKFAHSRNILRDDIQGAFWRWRRIESSSISPL